jgi:hypothetical protein
MRGTSGAVVELVEFADLADVVPEGVTTTLLVELLVELEGGPEGSET